MEQIIAYCRYVDDILIICNRNKSNIEETLNHFNNMHHGKINFLGNTIHVKDKQLEFSINRKPTQLDLILPNSSGHPYEHELSGKIFIKLIKPNFGFHCQFYSTNCSTFTLISHQ
jgi:hypothetical protein